MLLFASFLSAFAYFNQGGGWNQNARFAEVRAMAEQQRFAIDDFLVYRRAAGTDDLVRIPARHATYEFDGKQFSLAWDYSGLLIDPDAEGEITPMFEACASGDVSYVAGTGHFHPNKPPGTSFLALPGYALIAAFERLVGINRDHWWTLTVNAWLTSVLSVALVSAFGCVLFFRLARELADGNTCVAALTTISFAFGTTFLPFSTILFDHNLTASLLVAAFYFLRRAARSAFVVAGLCAGFAVLTNYVAAGAVVALAFYAFVAESHIRTPREWDWRRGMLFIAGGLPLAFVLGWYHFVNFGSPFTLATAFQSPIFKDPKGTLGMFGLPNPYVGALLLVSTYRGLFVLAPVLILGAAGLYLWLREKRWVAEARLCLAIFGFFFLVNTSFNGYHGGFSAGPRYLVPGIPFLALPLVVAFLRWRRWALLLLAVSISQQLLLTATDAQNPLAVGGHARLDDAHRKDDFFCNIVTEYAWPLFATGRCRKLIGQLLEARLEAEKTNLADEIADPAEVERALAARRAEWHGSIERGEQQPLLLAAISGPVSVNPLGIYDGLLGFGNFDIHSTQAHWASCNIGEFIFPMSRWSILPVVLISGGLAFLAVRFCNRAAA